MDIHSLDRIAGIVVLILCIGIILGVGVLSAGSVLGDNGIISVGEVTIAVSASMLGAMLGLLFIFALFHTLLSD
jgi:hypothetical protein